MAGKQNPQEKTSEANEGDLIAQRKQKLKNLIERGVEPYPYSFQKKNNASELLAKYKDLKNDERAKGNFSVAGRVMTLRVMGKAGFMHIQDQTGKIQVYAREEEVGEDSYKTFSKLDLGDIVGVEGEIFRTRLGEVSIWAKKVTILTKSLLPLPEKWHGLKDKEIRYRRRELDLICNPEVLETFRKRSAIISAMREFLDSRGFLEVEIPTLQPVYGGAEARPFITHLNELDMKVFLSISPELYLKRLIVGGYDKVYTICKNFRNEGIDRTHNPEFTMMECYAAYEDYNYVMKLTEEMYAFIAKKVLGTTKIKYKDKELNLAPPWPRLTVKEGLKKYGKLDVDKLKDKELFDLVEEHKIDLKGKKLTRGIAIMLLFEELVEEHLTGPVFAIDYPREASPLCKQKRGDPQLIEKVEPYINGWESGNGYSELNNPIIQRELLNDQAKQLREGNEEASPMDEDFAKAIELGMPPTAGLGIGIDRMVIILTNSESIRDVIPFPFMKRLDDDSEENTEKKDNSSRK